MSLKLSKKRQQTSLPTDSRPSKRSAKDTLHHETHLHVPDALDVQNNEVQPLNASLNPPEVSNAAEDTALPTEAVPAEAVETATSDSPSTAEQLVNDDIHSDSSGRSAHSLALATKQKSERALEKSKDKSQGTLDHLKVVNGTDWGYNQVIHSRIDSIRALVRPDNGTFYISKAPSSIEWVSSSSPMKKKFWTLGTKGGKIPIKFWFVGTVVDTWFFEDGGDPLAQVAINVKMLDEADMNAANSIMRRFSVGNERPPVYPDIRFNKWTTIHRTGETRKVPEIFSDLYDARKGVKLPREKMMFYPPQDLKADDLVLVEATVQRYHNHKENGKTVYSTWLATFGMNFVAILHDSPSTRVDEDIVGPAPDVDLSF